MKLTILKNTNKNVKNKICKSKIKINTTKGPFLKIDKLSQLKKTPKKLST